MLSQIELVLHDAVWQNNIAGVRLLVNAGARLDIKGKNGDTPTDLAKKSGRKEIVAILSGHKPD